MTQIDQPDTPAPVFAARAFKSALFGTPARPSDTTQIKSTTDRPDDRMEQGSKTPPKPPAGILLTPGTGTSRRKRVSFGQDVGKKTSLSFAAKTTESRHRRLDEALHKLAQRRPLVTKPTVRHDKRESSEDEWEEDNDDENCHDITVDLNEPHSQSGKYWKEEFQKYHEDAKAEMEKLLKYKQLAKSYAKQKDAEATQLAELLKEEQQKVIVMEKQISEGASKMVSKQGDASTDTSPELLATLTKQTALAVQYRTRVQDLEEQLENFLRDKESDSDAKDRRRRLATSPRTQKTLLETQRELRRARNQVKELGELRDQVSGLKSKLRAMERRATRAEAETANSGTHPESSRAQELRSQLREAKEATRAKDEELRQLKKEFETYREETKTREDDTKGVLERAHNKISDLKREIRTLKATPTEPAARPKSWHPAAEVDVFAEGGLKADQKPTIEGAKPRANALARKSFDLTDLDEPVGKASGNSARTLREKFSEETQTKTNLVSATVADRPTLERPRWQPYVPRSPRNRDYLGEENTNTVPIGTRALTSSKGKEPEAFDLPGLAKTVAHSSRRRAEDKIEAKVDLLQDRFAPLGAPEVKSGAFLSDNPKSSLPPERRAAAMARIEQRMAEKKRATRQRGQDKENVRP